MKTSGIDVPAQVIHQLADQVPYNGNPFCLLLFSCLLSHQIAYLEISSLNKPQYDFEITCVVFK